jgi:hypothetical protein
MWIDLGVFTVAAQKNIYHAYVFLFLHMENLKIAKRHPIKILSKEKLTKPTRTNPRMADC